MILPGPGICECLSFSDLRVIVVEKLFDQIDSGLAKDKTTITKVEKIEDLPGMPDKYM